MTAMDALYSTAQIELSSIVNRSLHTDIRADGLLADDMHCSNNVEKRGWR